MSTNFLLAQTIRVATLGIEEAWRSSTPGNIPKYLKVLERAAQELETTPLDAPVGEARVDVLRVESFAQALALLMGMLALIPMMPPQTRIAYKEGIAHAVDYLKEHRGVDVLDGVEGIEEIMYMVGQTYDLAQRMEGK